MSNQLPLKKSLPPGRSYDQVLNHYKIERNLANQLLASSREQRSEVFGRMYDELFDKVPDHPRLTRRGNGEMTSRANRSKWSFIQRHVKPSSRVLEFGAGDCLFSIEMTRRARKVYAADISAQHDEGVEFPKNFELVIYDGYVLNTIEDGSVDVAFSDQLLEHLHPDDTPEHLALALTKLAPGGVYVLRTPHRFNGPHDVSQYFSDTPDGFHLKEWTFRELNVLATEIGYSQVRCYWAVKGFNVRLPYMFYAIMEPALEVLPQKLQRTISKIPLPTLCVGLYR
jgi:SAM-dependent methyltransferase